MTSLAPGDAFPHLRLRAVDGDVELRERWERGPLVVMFMRHFGCAFCREQLRRMGRAFGEFRAAGADVVAVFQYDADATQRFCDGRDVPFDCLGDPERAAYAEIGLGRGSPAQIVNLKVAMRFLDTARHGVFGGPPRGGDVAQLPGTFVVDRDGHVVLAHYSSHSADNPAVDDVLGAVRSIPGPDGPAY
jgi:peroxiredoxin